MRISDNAERIVKRSKEMLELPGLTLFCILNPAHSRIHTHPLMKA